jgi:hexosaminidase
MPHHRLETLVPRPRHIQTCDGIHRPASDPVIVIDPPAAAPEVHTALSLVPIRTRMSILLRQAGRVPEAFRLEITPDQIAIDAADHAGLLHAIQTIRQLLPPDALRTRPPAGLDLALPCCIITDAPHFAWRGAMLDVARHFLPKHEVLRHIDILALHRVNRLQLHLTDEQGWRLESTAFPRLTSHATWRAETQISHFRDAAVFDPTPHGGYYSKADLREIHDHAADRGILLVPEIELPGHCGALLAAYPELGAPMQNDRRVLPTWGLHDTLFAPTAANLATVERILAEILDYLPGRYIHVGGDESRLGGWAQDPRVQDYATEQGLSGAPAIFAHLMSRLGSFLAGHGRRMITWDDSFATQSLAGQPVGEEALIMAWRGLEVARRAAAAGRDVVLAPVWPTYFDYTESAAPEEPLAIGGPISLADVAAWTATPADWSASEQSRILGLQCQVWTEFVRTPRRVDYMLYPRLCAFADIAWTGQPSDVARLEAHLKRLDALGVEYRPPSGPHPWQQGGTGASAHRRLAPMPSVLARHAEAAARGETPDDATHRAVEA